MEAAARVAIVIWRGERDEDKKVEQGAAQILLEDLAGREGVSSASSPSSVFTRLGLIGPMPNAR